MLQQIDYNQLLKSTTSHPIDYIEAKKHFDFLCSNLSNKEVYFAFMKKDYLSVSTEFIRSNVDDDFNSIINNVNQHTHNYYNCYLSVNTFNCHRRQIPFLFDLNCIFVDIDNHSRDITDLDIKRLCYHLQEYYFGTLIPHPNLIVDSGRGLQLYWKIKPVYSDKKFYGFWKTVEKGFIDILSTLYYEGFTVDKQVCDATRVLRLAGSFNHTANRYTKILYMSEDLPQDIYTLSILYDDAIAHGIKAENTYVPNKKRKHKKKRSVVLQDYSNSNKTLMLQSRLDDLFTLIELRHGDMVGSRQTMIFHIANILRTINTPKELIYVYLNKANDLFVDPLPENEVTHELYRHKIYKMRTTTIISQLKITKTEQHQLKSLTLDSKDNKKPKASKRQKKKAKLSANIKELFQSGKTQKEIATKLSISERTVRNYIKELNLSKPLSTCEQVQRYKASGFSQQEVAEKLGKSIRTVRSYWNKTNNEEV